MFRSAYRLLGHAIEEQALKVTIPKRLSAPGLPELNHSQVGLGSSSPNNTCSLCFVPPAGMGSAR